MINGPNIKMEYQYDDQTNMVTGIMYSDEELKDTKKAWKLSEDKLTYTNDHLTSNGSYTTVVEDQWGNQSSVLIDVKLVDDKRTKYQNEIPI